MLSVLGFLAPVVVKLVEKSVGGKDGSIKKTLAVDITKTVLKTLLKKKKIENLPSEDEISGAIETTVADLNNRNVLRGEETVLEVENIAEIFSGISKVLDGASGIFKQLSNSKLD